MPASTTDRASLAEFVVERREALGLRQSELADRAGLTRAYVSALERGRLGMPSVDQRRALADALRVRHVDLLIAAGELDAAEIAKPIYRDFVRHPDLMRQVEALDDATADVLSRFLAVFNAKPDGIRDPLPPEPEPEPDGLRPARAITSDDV